MSTELQSQVNALRKSVLLSSGLTQVPSLFLTSAEAAKVDVSAVYEAAIEGLHSLAQYDTSFLIYETLGNVLSRATVSLQRELKTREENHIIDRQLHELLQRLSLYASEIESHKIIEYLLRRYRAHELNAPALIQAFFHLHDTKVFARLVQLCVLQDSIWLFLDGVKRSGIPIARANIVKRCEKDASLFRSIGEYTRLVTRAAYAKGIKTTPLAVQGAQKILSFYVAVALELCALSIRGDHLRAYYTFIHDGIHFSSDAGMKPFRRPCSMIVAQLSRTAPLTDVFIDSVLKHLAVAWIDSTDSETDELTLTICIVLTYQKVCVSYAVLEKLFSDKTGISFVRSLESIAAKFTVSEAVTCLMESLVKTLSVDITVEISIRYILQLLAASFGSSPIALRALQLTLSSDLHATAPFLPPLLRMTAQKFPEAFEAAISAAQSGPAADAVKHLLQESFLDSKYNLPTSSGVSLCVALTSQSLHIRAEAMQLFGEHVPADSPASRDLRGLSELVSSNLRDESSDFAATAWTSAILSRVALQIEPSSLLQLVSEVWQSWIDRARRRSSGAWAVLNAIINALADKTVITTICSEQCSLDSGMSGQDWFTQTLVSVACGSLRKLSGREDDDIASLESAVMAVAKMSKFAVPLFSALKSSKAQATTAIPICLKSLAVEDMNTFSRCVHSLCSSTTDNMLAISRLFCNTLQDIADVASLDIIVATYTPMLGSLLHTCEPEESDEVAQHVSELIKHLKREAIIIAYPTLAFYISLIKEGDIESNLEMRFLLSLLRSKQSKLTALSSLVLGQCFSLHPEMALIKIAYSSSAAVTDGIRASCLCMLIPFISSINDSGSVSSFVSSDIQEPLAKSLLLIIPLVITYIVSSNYWLRLAAIELTNAFASLGKKLTININADKKGGGGMLIKVTEIIDLMKHIHSGSVTPPTSVALAIKDALIEMIKLFNWSFPIVTLAILHFLSKKMTFAEQWSVFEALYSTKDKSSKYKDVKLYDAVFLALGDSDDVDQKTVSRISTFVVNLLNIDASRKHSRQQILSLIATKWAVFFPAAQRESIFEALLTVQKTSPGQLDVVQALGSIGVDLTFLCSKIQSDCGMLQQKIEANLSIAEADATVTDIESDDESTAVDPLSAPILQFCSTLEALVDPLRRSATSKLFESLSPLMTLLFNTLGLMNKVKGESIALQAEYCKTLILEAIFISLSRGSSCDIFAPKSSSSAKKKKKAAVETDEYYSADRVLEDIDQIFLSLQNSKSSGLQLLAINTLDILLELVPSVILDTIQGFSKLLTKVAVDSLTSVNGLSERETLLNDILRKLCNILQKSGDDFKPQQVLQPLLFHFTAMFPSRRNSLVNSAVDILGDSSLASCVSVILTHALVAYDPEDSSPTVDETTNSYILLSRSSQRKSQRVMKSSKPEDIFRLALEFSLIKPATSQVQSLVTTLKVCQTMFRKILYSSKNDVYSSNSVVKSTYMIVDVDSLEMYAKAAFAHASSRAVNAEGIRASLLLLHLEYVFETLENTTFHRGLIRPEDVEEESIQSMFIEVVEQLLELIAAVSESLHERYENEFEDISLQLGGAVLQIQFPQLAQCVYDWSLNIIRALQKLLDNPTFIAILQELLDHELTAVRQRAVQMLSERLSDVRLGGIAEHHLYVDLCSRLKNMIAECTQSVESKIDSAALAARGLMQSAVMCVDVLAKALGKEAAWVDGLVDTLEELLKAIASVTFALANTSKDSEINLDLLKLLGSIYLCSGTICATTGPRAVSHLSQLMAMMIKSLVKQGDRIIKLSFKNSQKNKGQVESHKSKTIILFLRSVVSAITSVASEVPVFLHPHIHAVVTSLLCLYSLESIYESSSLDRDIDRCFRIIVSAMPFRLSIPSTQQHLLEIFALGHKQSKRYAEHLSFFCSSIDRETLMNYSKELTLIVVSCLDYRTVFRAGSPDSDTVEESIIAAVVEYCLKLTEPELKKLLLKLSEWKDKDENAASLKTITRGYSFFQLTSALSEKLRSIFIPLMSYVWPTAVTSFDEILAFTGKGNKKRKAGEDIDVAECSERRYELVHRSKWVLESIRSSCIHDSDGFVDEERFNAMTPKVSELLSKVTLFDSLHDYSAYMDEHVIPTLTALTSALRNDVLWKPLNHKLLMLTREKKKELRATAVKALHSLFLDIGEDYLVMLPECLPFLSELLEEENETVLSLSVGLVKYIENLSGEKLDQYLQ